MQNKSMISVHILMVNELFVSRYALFTRFLA